MYVDVPQNGHPGQWFRRPNSLKQFLRIQILCLNGVWDVVWAPVFLCTSQWRHNERDSVLNHQPHHCLLKSLFGRRSKKTSKLRVTGLCAGNSPGTGEFPAQMDSDAENVSIWWRHHDKLRCYCSWLCTSGGTNHRSMAVITLRPRWRQLTPFQLLLRRIDNREMPDAHSIHMYKFLNLCDVQVVWKLYMPIWL